ncbi:hypothetical protein WR25_14377 [Diploscapter pachys]|uniref:Uncharacterized protein n=1 Tax=Diploscapter pachys TaxID=2018661 RepID=A0A2A2K245_9BILA|nr:hypothetical protein WR25_14377 [Diploscapter pachys]
MALQHDSFTPGTLVSENLKLGFALQRLPAERLDAQAREMAVRFFIQNRVDKNPPERADAHACRRLIEFATLPNGKLRFSLKQCPSEQQLVGLFGRLEDKRLAGKPLTLKQHGTLLLPADSSENEEPDATDD